ncbi:hypothetical protein AERO8C_170150 [Aeromonas veronii]|uniref:Uncharacterized protein n=1 Tax=Aeromonas veronii TaxID=654 RepID=A0A653KZ84_AERVE|nr:hypothetical protein AERO8C_170150 [Aeromonas veronii]
MFTPYIPVRHDLSQVRVRRLNLEQKSINVIKKPPLIITIRSN